MSSSTLAAQVSSGSAAMATMATTAYKNVRGNIERMMDKTMADMVRGIRNNRDNEARYIAQCMEEIKNELRNDTNYSKANAVTKLVYLEMLGYDISWAAFNIIEVMSSTKFTHKRIGYLAASHCFTENTEILMLATNLIRKDMNSANMYDSGIALCGLSCFVTPDLARDLANDVVTLLTSSKPYIRKKAVLLLYKVFLRYPEALRPTFPRLKEKLEDPDPGVRSAAVNVICELARKNPKNYLSLSPLFFKLMTTSTNNWMLIKIIKLFGALTPLEPRLGKKLIEPLTNLINSTSAMSLLYECINTVIAVLISISSGAPGDHTASIQLCVQKLSILIEDSDQNLKYLGLSAMARILQTHPKIVQSHKDLILGCLDDKDESIRLRALDLLYGMVSKKNIVEIVKRLMSHVEKAEGTVYRDELLTKIIQICSHNNYQFISNFEWYISVLVELTRVEGSKHGALIAQQTLDVAVRVQSIRHFAVSQMALILENAHLLLSSNVQTNNMSEVLYAAALICGEFSEHLRNPQNVLESMLRTKVILLPGHIQSFYVQNIAKLYSEILTLAERDADHDRIASLDNLMLSKLPQYELSDDLEVQERACSLLELMKRVDAMHKQNGTVAAELSLLFEGDLNPVAPKAQRKVPVPTGLDLEAWINTPPESSESEQSEPEEDNRFRDPSPFEQSDYTHSGARNFAPLQLRDGSTQKKVVEPTAEEVERMKVQRAEENAANPYYLKKTSKPTSTPPSGHAANGHARVNTGGISTSTSVELQTPLEIPGIVGLDQYNLREQQTMSWKKAKKEKKTKKGKKGRARKQSSSEEETVVAHVVNRDEGEMPEGAQSSDDEKTQSKRRGVKDEVAKALDVDLDKPLSDDERLPVARHRVTSPTESPSFASPTPPISQQPTPVTEKPRKKKKKEKTEKKEKKKKKTKSSKDDALVPEVEPAPSADAKPSDDLDFWLSGTVPQQPTIAEPAAEPSTSSLVKEAKKSRKDRIGSSSSKGKRSSKRVTEADRRATMLSASSKNKSEYENPSGICTPTRNADTGRGDSGAVTPQQESPSNVRPLASNKTLQLMFATEVTLAEPNSVYLRLICANASDKQLQKLELNVVETGNSRLVRQNGDNNSDSVVIVPTLPSGQTTHAPLKFAVEHTNAAHKMRGTLSYMVTDEAGSIPDKLDFTLRLPVLTFTVANTISGDSFADLLTSGTLSAKSSVSFPVAAQPFATLVERLCQLAHFAVVECTEDTASLFSQTIQSQTVCLLVKLQDTNSVSIDGKSSEQHLVEAILQEIQQIMSS